jgi:general secretion pathway protein D
VVARSGQTILLAGLISESHNNNSTSVPWLGKIPGLGWLFSSASVSNQKTELVLLITPRVIEGPDEWDAVRGGLERALEHIKLPAPPVTAPPPAAPGRVQPKPAGAAPASLP